MSAFLLCVALVFWLLARTPKRSEKAKRWLTNFKRLFLILALWAFLEKVPIWPQGENRLVITEVKQLDDFRASDAATLVGSSQVWFGGKVSAGCVPRTRLSALGESLNSRIGDPGPNQTLVWMVNARPSTVYLGSHSVFIFADATDEKSQKDSLWIGWLAEPMLSSVRKIDAAIN